MTINEMVSIIEKKGGDVKKFERREYDRLDGSTHTKKYVLSASLNDLCLYRYKIDTEISSYEYTISGKQVSKEYFETALLKIEREGD